MMRERGVRSYPESIRMKSERIEWRDLVVMRPVDGLAECFHPLGWLIASWTFAAFAIWPLAIAASFMFFLTALRLNHEAIHGNLGFGPHGHRRILHALSLVMLGSNHAVAFNHLRHHRHLGTPQDVEGKAGRMTLFRVLAYGPCFPFENHRNAWRDGGAVHRRRMLMDAGLNLAMIGTAIGSRLGFLTYHVAMMLVAQCLTAFFAVWITHHDCAPGQVARTQRAPLINWLSYNMFLHREHHLFPAVPVRRLGVVAQHLHAVGAILVFNWFCPSRFSGKPI
jgi:fatty acid desaturase